MIFREVWPENDSFGHANMAAEDEFLAMREIFMTDLCQPTLAGQRSHTTLNLNPRIMSFDADKFVEIS